MFFSERIITCCIVAFLLPFTTHSQHSNPDTIQATSIFEKITLDGKFDESLWQTALSIENFTQRELKFGQPVSEKTKCAIVYDRLALYIGIWCYQGDAESIRAKYMQRDFNYDEDDNFQVALSPFSDRRNGYLFIINPNGARADLLISGNESANKDWNGVWDVRTNVTSEGWFGEIRIPFNSLQFRRDSLPKWNINFERNIRNKNEQALWQGWTRDCSIYCLVNAGTLTGLKNIGYASRFELKPYGLGGFEKLSGKSTEWQWKSGGDLNVNLTPTLKLNLTANTDFAQVEADRIAVNLTRFNLYYPEKREFFLEGYQNYKFSLGNSNELFYTRKIGIENLRTVPIIAGARLFGKMGSNNIGILNIVTGKQDSIPATNNTVVRYKRDIGSQSYIGAIITSKINSNISNQVAGVDGAYSTSHFLKNKNLVIGGLVSRSFDKNKSGAGAYSWRFYADYPNDLIDNFIGISSIQENYNPELGFLNRKNFDNLSWFLRFTPRWFTGLGIRKMYFRPWGFDLFRSHTTGKVESFLNESRPLGFFTKSGERFEYNLYQQYERLETPFNITDSILIPSGEYWMHRMEIQLGSFRGRRIWAEVGYAWGDFYTGKIKTFETSMGINISKHFNLKTDYINNDIRLPEGDINTHELAQYFNVAINPRLDMAIFVQWNSLDDLLFGNFKLHWIPNIGSDLYVVYNRGYNKLDDLKLRQPSISSGVAKLVWRIAF
jgi:hypothetical protein